MVQLGEQGDAMATLEVEKDVKILSDSDAVMTNDGADNNIKKKKKKKSKKKKSMAVAGSNYQRSVAFRALQTATWLWVRQSHPRSPLKSFFRTATTPRARFKTILET